MGGTVEDFESIAITFRWSLAVVLGVPAGGITLHARSGSVSITATITSATPTTAAAVSSTLEAHTPTTLSTALVTAATTLPPNATSGPRSVSSPSASFQVLDLAAPVITSLVVAPPAMPSPSAPSGGAGISAVGALAGQTPGSSGDGLPTAALAALLISLGSIALVALALAIRFRRQGRLHPRHLAVQAVTITKPLRQSFRRASFQITGLRQSATMASPPSPNPSRCETTSSSRGRKSPPAVLAADSSRLPDAVKLPPPARLPAPAHQLPPPARLPAPAHQLPLGRRQVPP